MKKKRLSKENAAEIVKLLGEGKDAKELANTYNVSVATIYNFRTRLKREGTPVESKKRGRKPKTEKIERVFPKTPSTEFLKLQANGRIETYKFIVNGVAVTVSEKAKNVHIAPDSMIVNF
jgi:hypothetical protein